ncbi:MAG: hypothetical protein H7328_07445 [Bdellovibrio sp.]|nr:hypothetical protein [Bdellovibrio sp.]
MQAVIAFLILMSINIVSLGSEYACFKNEDEYKTVKDKLPKILQEVPVYFAVKDTAVLFKKVSVVVNMQFIETKIRFNLQASVDIDSQPQELVSICANENQVKLTFSNKKTERFGIDGDTMIVTYGVKIKKVDSAQYKTVLKMIAAKTLDDSPESKALNVPISSGAKQ